MAQSKLLQLIFVFICAGWYGLMPHNCDDGICLCENVSHFQCLYLQSLSAINYNIKRIQSSVKLAPVFVFKLRIEGNCLSASQLQCIVFGLNIQGVCLQNML